MYLDHPHEGSTYAPQKDLQMSIHRSEHVASHVTALQDLKKKHQEENARAALATRQSESQLSAGDANATTQQQSQYVNGDP